MRRRRAEIDNRRAEIEGKARVPDGPALRKSLQNCFQDAAERIKSFTEEERQRFLRLLVNSVVYEGDQVRIKGIVSLSLARQGQHSSIESGPEETSSKDQKGSITSGPQAEGQGRHRITDMTLYLRDHNSVNEIAFEFSKPLPNMKPLWNENRLECVGKLRKEYPDATLRELCYQFERQQQLTLSISSMSRALKLIGQLRTK